VKEILLAAQVAGNSIQTNPNRPIKTNHVSGTLALFD